VALQSLSDNFAEKDIAIDILHFFKVLVLSAGSQHRSSYDFAI